MGVPHDLSTAPQQATATQPATAPAVIESEQPPATTTPATTTPAPNGPSPLLGLPGAVPATGIDSGTAWHYGDPIGEQRASLTGSILVDLSNRAILTVSGPDRLTWLHTLTSQFLSTLGDGDATQALILSPQGHVEHHAWVTEIGGVTYLDTEPGAGIALREYLDSMRFWSKVEVGDGSRDVAQLALIGPRSAAVVQHVLGVSAPPPGRAVPIAAAGFVRATTEGLDVFIARAEHRL